MRPFRPSMEFEKGVPTLKLTLSLSLIETITILHLFSFVCSLLVFSRPAKKKDNRKISSDDDRESRKDKTYPLARQYMPIFTIGLRFCKQNHFARCYSQKKISLFVRYFYVFLVLYIYLIQFVCIQTINRSLILSLSISLCDSLFKAISISCYLSVFTSVHTIISTICIFLSFLFFFLRFVYISLLYRYFG